jgi:hypothetical protein
MGVTMDGMTQPNPQEFWDAANRAKSGETEPPAAQRHMRERIEEAIGLSFLQYAPDDTKTGAAKELRDQIIAIIETASPHTADTPHGVGVARATRAPGREFRVGVWNKSQPDGPILKFSQDEWRDFVRDVKDGRYDVEAL